MSEDIASLAIRIDALEARNATRDLRLLEQQGSRTERSANALSSAFKSLGIAIGAASLGRFIKSGIDALDTLNDLSLKTGIAANKLAGMGMAAEQSGTSIDSFAHAINLLSVNMANNSQAFAKLGISAKEPLQAFYQLVGVMEAIDDPQTRAAVGAQALGRGWQELAPLLANGVNGLKQAVEQGEKLSGVTVKATKDADAFNDQLAEMTTWLGSVAIKLAGPIIDGFNQLAAHIREATNDGLTFMNVMRGIADFATGTDTLSGYAKQLKDTNDLITDQENKVAAIKNASSITSKMYENAGIDIKKEKQSLDNLYRQQEELYLKVKKTTEPQKSEAATAPDSKAIKDFIGIKEKQTKAVRAHSTAVKESVSEETKAYNQLQSAYESLDESLRKQLALSKMTDNKQAALEYDLESGALKNLSEAKKLYLLQTSAEIENNQLASQENETKKSEMDALIDKYNQLTLSARDYYKTKLEGEGIKGAAQEPLLKQYDKNNKVEASQKAIEDSRASLQAWIDDVNTANDSMEGLGATTTSVFQGALGGINQLTGSVDTMVKSLQQNMQAFENLAKRKQELDTIKPDRTKDSFMIDMKQQYDAKKAYESEYSKLQQKTTNDSIDGIMQLASATASMFEENSNEAKAFNLIALAGLAAKAATAVLTQGQGDPYTAFARMAAMGALVAGVVSSGGGGGFSFSGGGAVSAPKTTSGTGTVLGGSTDQESSSVNNVYDLLKNIHAEEYAELRGINRGVTALNSGITNTITKIFQVGGLNDLALGKKPKGLGEKIQVGFGGSINPDPILNYILKGIFGVKTQKIVGGGISTGAFQAGGDVSGQQYQTVATTTKSWFSTKTKYSTQTAALDQGVEDSLTSIFKSMSSVMLGVAGNLGKVIGKDIGHKVNEYIVPAMQIELRGLNGEEAAKKLNGVISAALDTMSEAVFGDIIGQYQKLGEGMLETAIRIVSEVAVVRDALNQSGMKMGSNAVELSDALVQAAGGLEQFQQQFEEFYDKFFTDTEKQSRLQTRLNETFAEVYMLLPRTREEYRKVMESLKLSNAEDRERYSLMLQLSGAADQYYGGLESKVQAASSSNSDRVQLEIQLMKLSGNAAGALAKERELELAAMDKSLRSLQKLIYSLTDYTSALESSYNKAAGLLTSTFTKFFTLAKSLVQYRDALKVGDMSTGSPGSKYQANKDAFESVRDIIKAGPGKGALSEQRYQNALESLQGVSEKFLASSRDYNASGKNYANDYNNVLKTLTSGANKSLNVASDAEQQLNALNDVVSGISELNLSFISLDGSIKQVSSDIWAASKASNEKAFLNATSISDENKKALGQDGVLGTLKANGVLTSLMKKGVISALGTKGLLGALGEKGVLGALGQDGVLGALGQKGVLGALGSKDGIKGLLKAGGPIAKALGKSGVLGALGENQPLLKALGADGVLGALGQKGVLGTLKSNGVLTSLMKTGVVKALGTTGVMGALTGTGGVKASLTGTGSVASAVNLVRDAINGTGSVKGGGLNGAIDDVSKSIDNLNGSAGIKGAVESVHDAIKGLTTAIASISKLQADRDKVMSDAAKAEAKAAADRAKAQKALDDKRAAAELKSRKAQYDKVSERASFGSINELFRVSGIDQGVSKGVSDWAKSLIGSFDPADSMKTLVDMAYLLEEFRLFSTGKDTGHAGAWYATEFQKLRDREQSHANGLEFVPYDGYKATLHQGERVQTRHNANADNEETNRIYKEILLELKAANKQRGAVAMETFKKVDKLISANDKQARALAR